MPLSLTRRVLLAAPVAALPAAAPASVLVPGAAAPAPLTEGWARFRQGYLRPEGRVVDTGNRGVSHSEGQGWSLFLAERCADRASFDLLWNWTRKTLSRPSDRLLAWRYMPDSLTAVPDRNNATDGDLFAAAALLLAGQRWDNAAYTEAGAAIARDVLRLLVREVAGEMVLLPAHHGFEAPGHVVLNPSYYAFPVLGVLARAMPDTAWLRLAQDGIALLRRARFGRWGLPPDWVEMKREDGALRLPAQWPSRFSYDAVRVPLYLCWAGLDREPPAAAARHFWSENERGYWPAWTDLSNNLVASYPASPGIQELGRWVSELGGTRPKVSSAAMGRDDYYSNILKLLTMSAKL